MQEFSKGSKYREGPAGEFHEILLLDDSDLISENRLILVIPVDLAILIKCGGPGESGDSGVG